jgi:hypothetical protein
MSWMLDVADGQLVEVDLWETNRKLNKIDRSHCQTHPEPKLTFEFHKIFTFFEF